MKKSQIILNRKVFFLAGIVLSLSVLVFAGWGQISQLGAQIAGVFSADADQASSEKSELRERDDPEGRSNWFMYQRMYPFDKVPEGARKRAWNQIVALGEGFGPEGAGATWTPVGPMPTAGAGPGGDVSGRLNEIAVSPANNQIILVAGGTGGIWRSTNGGTTFAPVTDNQADLAVGAITFAPSNANIVYAGMGDNDSGYFGTGVLKSTDAGATWTQINNNTLPDKVRSTSLKVDAGNPDKVYLAVSNFLNTANCTATDRRNCGENAGIYVSSDGGVNWTRTLAGVASDVAIHPTNAQIIYAGIRFGDAAADLPGLYKSTDGGTNWTRVYDSPFTSNMFIATEDFRIAVTPAAPDRVYIYLGQQGSQDRRLEMSTDAGATFTNRGAIGTSATGIDPGQFGYNTYLVADPTNADTVWVGSRDFFKSTDGGSTFTNLNNSWKPPYTCGDCFQENMQKVHTDQQSFAFVPGDPNTFLVGNDGGIFKTTDGGANFTSLNTTLSLAQLYDVAIHPTDGSRSYAGAQDNGSQSRTPGTNRWVEFTQTGDGGKLAINSANPSIVFLGGTTGNIIRNTGDGTPQTQVDIASAATFGGTRINFFAPVVANGVDNRLYSGSFQLYICSDCDTSAGEGTWTRTSTMDLTKGGDDTLQVIAVAKSNTNVIYTGSTQGKAMRSTDNGATWTDITIGLPNRSITDIEISATDPTLVYLTVSAYGSGHIFRSTDSGTTWTNISNNLPDIPTNAVLIDPQTATTLYAGTDIGVFRSTDSGANWSVFNTGLPPVPVTSFTAQASGKIQISTYGRGVYELGTTVAPTNRARADYDGDGKTDLSVFRGNEGNWYLNRSTAGFTAVNWGINSDLIVPADYDGDRKTDFAVWRPSDVEGESDFYILNSSNSTVSGIAWGVPGDIPVVADYDGDEKADVAVWRPATGDFFVLQSQSGNLRHYNFGTNGDKPVPGDFDGDGKADFGVFRPSNGTWYIARSTDNGVTISAWGIATDIPVFADYDGDSKNDIAVFRPSDGVWYVQRSTGGMSFIPFGTDGDIPVPGDYDGDGKSDQAVYRGGVWYLNNSTSGFSANSFGLMSDIPTPRNYLPQ